MTTGNLQATSGVPMAPPRLSAYTLAVALIAALRHIPRIVGVWFERAEARRRLAMLNDHMLRDIGLTHADVDRELLKRFWRE
jgi:uncharacterized protein YjiS (DUF1127 family)